MKRITVAICIGVVALAAAGAVLYVALLPPSIPVPEQRNWIFRNVTLIEPGRPARPGRTLRIESGRIVSISRSSVQTAATGRDEGGPAEAQDLEGLYATPGLIDMHVHYPPAVAIGNRELWSLLFLAHGVTTVRETGSIDGSIFDVRAAIERGESPGPRIFACGRVLDGSPPSFPSNRIVTTPKEARQAVRDQAGAGADCIKAYNMLAAPVLAAIVDEARELGLPVIGHVPHSVSFEEAGLVDLQHGTGAVVVDLEKIGRMDFRWEDWASVDDGRIRHVAHVSRGRDIAHTPTLVNGRMRELLLDPVAGDAAMAADTGLRHLPRFWIGVWETLWGPPYAPDDVKGAAATAYFRGRQAALAAGLHAAGVRVHAGTDTLMPYVAPGSSLYGELVDLRAAGIAARDVWHIATRTAGLSLGGRIGTLAPGAPADLLFLRPGSGDDLPAFDRIEAVLANGRLYRRSDLEEALARLDGHFQGPLYETVMSAATRVVRGYFAP